MRVTICDDEGTVLNIIESTDVLGEGESGSEFAAVVADAVESEWKAAEKRAKRAEVEG